MTDVISSKLICRVLRDNGIINERQFLDTARLAGQYPNWEQLRSKLIPRLDLCPTIGQSLYDRFIRLAGLSCGAQGICDFVFDMKARLPRVLKRLRKKSAPDARRRMKREAYVGQTLTTYRHPSLVQVVEAPDNDARFIILEHIDFRGNELSGNAAQVSCDVQTLVTRGRTLSPAEALRFGAQIACGLQRMEASHFVHRDVKPGNLLVARPRQQTGDRPYNSAVLGDFGLARIMPEALHKIPEWEDAFGKTHVGVKPLTKLYAPAEQFYSSEVDSRADQFGLGAAIHFMLTGRAPRTGSDFQKFAQDAISGRIPDSMQISIPIISTKLSQVLSTLLANAPDQRYGSFDEVIEELLACPESGNSLIDEVSYRQFLCQQSLLNSLTIE